MIITLPSISPLRRAVSVLAVSPTLDDHRALRAIFSQSIWTLRGVVSAKEALLWLERHPVPVVICKRELPDGNWQTLLQRAQRLPRPPRVLVSAASPDDQLWDEVGDSGGYDVLAIPFDRNDVLCAVRMAWESWRRQWDSDTNFVAAHTGPGDPNPPAA